MIPSFHPLPHFISSTIFYHSQHNSRVPTPILARHGNRTTAPLHEVLPMEVCSGWYSRKAQPERVRPVRSTWRQPQISAQGSRRQRPRWLTRDDQELKIRPNSAVRISQGQTAPGKAEEKKKKDETPHSVPLPSDRPREETQVILCNRTTPDAMQRNQAKWETVYQTTTG